MRDRPRAHRSTIENDVRFSQISKISQHKVVQTVGVLSNLGGRACKLLCFFAFALWFDAAVDSISRVLGCKHIGSRRPPEGLEQRVRQAQVLSIGMEVDY